MVLSTLPGKSGTEALLGLGCRQEYEACGRRIGAGGAESGQFVSLTQQLGRNWPRKPDIVGASLAENLVDAIVGDCSSSRCGNGGGCVGHVRSLLT
jgi:hypothetical protein